MRSFAGAADRRPLRPTRLRETNVRSILVLCRQRPAAGALSGGSVPRPDRQRHGRADTLVWTEGMAGWQKAGEVPGLMSAGAPPACRTAAAADDGGRRLSARPWRRHAVGRLRHLGVALARARAYCIGMLLVIPAPWACDWYLSLDRLARAGAGTAQSRLHRPAMTIIWYRCFVAAGIVAAMSAAMISSSANLLIVVQIVSVTGC